MFRVEFADFDLASFNGEGFLNRTYECALASCESDSMRVCDQSFRDGAKAFFEEGSKDWSFLSEEYCTGIELDLSGSGVSFQSFVH